MTTQRLDARRVPGIGWFLLAAGIALLACTSTSTEDGPAPTPSPTAAPSVATPRATPTLPPTPTPKPTPTLLPTPEPAHPPGPPASGVSTLWSDTARGTGAP